MLMMLLAFPNQRLMVCMPSVCCLGDGRPEFGAKGFSGSGKNITTKHDTVLCGRKNAERLLEVIVLRLWFCSWRALLPLLYICQFS